MTIGWSEAAKLEINARHHKYDARLDKIADAIESGDVEAWQKLPARLIGEADVYATFRRAYVAAVEAGVIPDDRGPSTA